MGGAKRYPSSSRPASMGIASLHPSYATAPRPIERNDGGSAPTFRHAWTADCALSAILQSCRRRFIRSVPEKLMSPIKARCGLVVLAVIAAMGGSVAVAQNLDQGKPAPKLFAESCASCHRSPAGARQGPLSAHALSVPAKALCQRFEFGLGADVLSGIHRQRKTRRGEVCGQDRRVAVTPVAAAGAGAGAIGALRDQPRLAHGCAAKSPQPGHLFDLCRPSIVGVRVAGSNDDGGG
jgi:hypothetical protein